jgi:glycine hydroxymethyltransferase
MSASGDLVARLDALIAEHNAVRGRRTLSLVAAHNILGPRALSALSSRLADKASSGRPGRRSHGGSELIEEIEHLALELARRVFRCDYVELRPMGGTMANEIVTHALLRPGDTILCLPPPAGHKSYLEAGIPGLYGLKVVHAPFDVAALNLDGRACAEAIRTVRPRAVFVGSAQVLYPYPLRDLREAVAEAGASIVYDAAHVLGLIAGGQFQDPLAEGAAVVTGSTHKTFPGPMGGIVLTNDPEVWESTQRVADRLVSNYQNNRIAALAYALIEMERHGPAFAAGMIRNARALARALVARGLRVLGHGPDYTDTHIVLVDPASTRYPDGRRATERLSACGIAASAMGLPGSPAGVEPRRGVRLGSNDTTRLGMGEAEMEGAAALVVRALTTDEPAARIRGDVEAFVRGFPRVHFAV